MNAFGGIQFRNFEIQITESREKKIHRVTDKSPVILGPIYFKPSNTAQYIISFGPFDLRKPIIKLIKKVIDSARGKQHKLMEIGSTATNSNDE